MGGIFTVVCSAALLIFVVLAVVLFSKLNLFVKYSRRGSDDNFCLEVFLWRGLVTWRLEVPVAVVPGPARLGRAASRVLAFYMLQRGTVAYLLRRLKILEFCWETDVGADDPAWTGFLAGLAWAVKGAVLLTLSRLVPVMSGPFKVNVRPRFDGPVLATRFHCQLEVGLSPFLFTAFKFFGFYLKRSAL